MSSSKEKSIKHLILSRTEYESKLNMILKKYFIKYFKELYDEIKKYKEFQKKLYNIPSWSSDKLIREFGYFTKYVYKKYNLNQNELSKILEIIYNLNIKIMTPLFNYPINNIPKFKDFWYKCIKKFGKFYYENPKLINDDVINYLDDTVKNVIQKFIPIKDIINTEKQKLEKYDFENELFSEKSIENSFSKEFSSKAKLEVELENTDHSEQLNHAATSDFENEYYNSEPEVKVGPKKLEKELVEEDEEKEKEIELPKYLFNKKKNYFNYKLSKMKKKNEMDEHFFD